MTPRKSNRRKSVRIVRQESLFSRIKSAPLDIWLSLNESIETIEWDSYVYTVGIPAAVILDVTLLVCRVIIEMMDYSSKSTLNKSRDQDVLLSSYDRSGGNLLGWLSRRRSNFDDDALFSNDGQSISLQSRLKAFFYGITSFTALIIILLGLANAWLVFNKTRTYTLLSRPLDKKPDTSSCRKIKISLENDNIPDEDRESDDPHNYNPFLKLFEAIKKFTKGSNISNDSSDPSSRYTEVWALDMWDPPVFNLYILSVFSPITIICVWFGPLSFFNILFITPLTSALLYFIVKMFLTKDKDKTIINSQVLQEYDDQIVKPIFSKARQDVSIGADGSVDFFLNRQQYIPSSAIKKHSSTSSEHLYDEYSTSETPRKPPPETLLSTPVFPSSLAVENSIRRKSGMPLRKLQYNPAGYFTVQPQEPQPFDFDSISATDSPSDRMGNNRNLRYPGSERKSMPTPVRFESHHTSRTPLRYSTSALNPQYSETESVQIEPEPSRVEHPINEFQNSRLLQRIRKQKRDRLNN